MDRFASRGNDEREAPLPLPVFLAASASATAVRMSATENGLVMTSWTMALRPEARSRWSAKPVINKIVRSGKSRAAASASAMPSITGIWISVSRRSKAPSSRVRISSASAPSSRGDGLVAVHGDGARHQRAHGIFIVGDQHARHSSTVSLASETARPVHTLPPARSRLLKKRTSILRPSGGGEASRDLNQARSPGFSTVCSSTAFQA